MIQRLVLVATVFATPAFLCAQVATVEPDAIVEDLYDLNDVLDAAHAAQAAFERIRLRYARVTLSGGGGSCDEHVGRFCTSYDEGAWYPREEAEEVGEARVELLQELDSLQALSPGDGWILGQRVWYRAEGGDWEGALSVSRACGAYQRWWCSALEGLALHGLGRYEDALESFETALARMEPNLAHDWRVPELAVDRDARGVLQDAEEAGPDSLATALRRLWSLADPLYLVDGNDRLTAHYARWTVATLKNQSRTPYGMTWSGDLDELTIRHGWELGWERSINSLTFSREGAVGHKHPEGRDFMPAGGVLRDPAQAPAADFVANRRAPRSLYAPEYAPVLLPIEPYVAVFPRGENALLVAPAFLPDDTTFHADHDHPRPWMEAGDQEDMPDRVGLFAMPVAGGEPLASTSVGGTQGALMLEVPAGDYVVSLESWSPKSRIAGRLRRGLRVAPAPQDVATLSDLLLLHGSEAQPESLEDALPLMLPYAQIHPDDALAVVWELWGLGFRPETLEYAVSVERTDRGLFGRLGQFFRLSGRPQPLALSWEEPAPDHPTAQFRHLVLDLPELDPGEYRITLTLRSPGRSDVTTTRTFQVVEE